MATTCPTDSRDVYVAQAKGDSHFTRAFTRKMLKTEYIQTTESFTGYAFMLHTKHLRIQSNYLVS